MVPVGTQRAAGTVFWVLAPVRGAWVAGLKQVCASSTGGGELGGCGDENLEGQVGETEVLMSESGILQGAPVQFGDDGVLRGSAFFKELENRVRTSLRQS